MVVDKFDSPGNSWLISCATNPEFVPGSLLLLHTIWIVFDIAPLKGRAIYPRSMSALDPPAKDKAYVNDRSNGISTILLMPPNVKLRKKYVLLSQSMRSLFPPGKSTST